MDEAGGWSADTLTEDLDVQPAARAAGSTSMVKAYASPLHWTFFAEILVIAYCLADTALLFSQGVALWAIPMLFWAMCLGLVAQLQMAPRLA